MTLDHIVGIKLPFPGTVICVDPNGVEYRVYEGKLQEDGTLVLDIRPEEPADEDADVVEFPESRRV